LRLPDSTTFAQYAIDHLKHLLGSKMMVDFNESVVAKYQNDRLGGGAAPKTINEDVGYLLRIPRECQIFAVKRLLGQLRCVVSNDSRQFA
jgi:hypothetical protein